MMRARYLLLIVGAAVLAVAGVVVVHSAYGKTRGSSAPDASASPSSVPESPPASSPPAQVSYVFPVRGTVSYARIHHGYSATDIMAPCGASMVAVTSGVVLEVTGVDRYDPKVNAGATRGGLSVSILGDDGVRYYGSHFSTIRRTLTAGTRVTAGEPIAIVGRTGDASACHVHFGISPPCRRTGDWWNRRGVVWPWPYLDSWRVHGKRSPAAEITGLKPSRACPSRPLVEP